MNPLWLPDSTTPDPFGQSFALPLVPIWLHSQPRTVSITLCLSLYMPSGSLSLSLSLSLSPSRLMTSAFFLLLPTYKYPLLPPSCPFFLFIPLFFSLFHLTPLPTPPPHSSIQIHHHTPLANGGRLGLETTWSLAGQRLNCTPATGQLGLCPVTYQGFFCPCRLTNLASVGTFLESSCCGDVLVGWLGWAWGIHLDIVLSLSLCVILSGYFCNVSAMAIFKSTPSTSIPSSSSVNPT